MPHLSQVFKCFLSILSASACCTTFAGNSGFCTVPRLTRGVPVVVEVEQIGKPLCGMAIIDGQYVPLERVARRKLEGPIHCGANGLCERNVGYYMADSDQQPFIIVFRGPRQAPNVPDGPTS